MKTRRRKRQPEIEETSAGTPTTIFSSDLLTPEEERELLADFWENKSELVRVLIRNFPKLRQHRPPLEPWPMAQFIRDHCAEEARGVAAVRRLHDRYVHLKHRLASANIRLAAHVAKRFRHHALSYADLLQEAVCGLMQAIDRFDVSHGTRLATYATWWIRQTLQIAVARQSHLVSLSPHHLQELGLLQQESEALAHGGKHLPSPQELASRTGSSLEQLPDGEPAAAGAQGPRPPFRVDRQRHPQPAADRPPAPHQQGAGASDPEPRPGEAAGLGRARRLGAEPAAGVSGGSVCRLGPDSG
jgi:RNA polymerase primary sigma factor